MRTTVTNRRYRERFIESKHLSNADPRCGHEPLPIPLNRASGTFSPAGGKDGMRGIRFMGLRYWLCARIGQ
jgi:hypothetical protein